MQKTRRVQFPPRSVLPEKAVAFAGSAVALIPLPGVDVFTCSIVVVGLLFPIFIAFLGNHTELRFFIWLALAVAVASPVLSLLAGASMTEMPQMDWVLRPVSLVVSATVIYWSSLKIGLIAAITLAVPAPMIFDLLTRPTGGNIWKYAVSVWISVALLVAVHRLDFMWKFAAVAVIVVLSALNDTRGLILMVAFGLLIELISRLSRMRMQRILISATGSMLLLWGSFQMAIAGVFGSSIQSTMMVQTQRGALTLLRTARPESGGNVALVVSDPFRFLISENLTAEQAAIIRNSFAQVDRDPHSMYVDRGVLQAAELHSIIADFWLHLGALGIAFSVAIGAFFIVLGLESLRSRSPLTLVVVFVSLRGIWDLIFSPISDLRFWPLYLVLGMSYVSFMKEDKCRNALASSSLPVMKRSGSDAASIA